MDEKNNQEITEIIIHGRGGQGAKSAAQILAEAALSEGKEIQTFPEYGPERTGAPMKAFVRISNQKIITYESITTPDHIIVIDPGLISLKELILEGITEKTKLFLNSKETKEALKQKLNLNQNREIYSIDANSIAIKHLRINKSNMPMLGAFIKVTNIVSLESLINSFKQIFKGKLSEEMIEANINCIKEAYNEVNQ